MNTLRLVVVGLFISILIACGSDSGSDSSSDTGNETSNDSGKNQGAIPGYQLQALDKAKNTENILLESEQKRKKQMEEQGL
jgi:hypothetical protein